MTDRQIKTVVARLERLAELIHRYKFSWWAALDKGTEPPARTSRWIVEYHELRNTYPEAWRAYCVKIGADRHHDAGDLLA